MATETHDVPVELNKSALMSRELGFVRESADLVLASRVMFEVMLTGWASDWLRLLARQLDQPVTVGRVVMDDLAIPTTSKGSEVMECDETLESNPLELIPAPTFHRRSTVDRIQRRAG